jgi:hypothetical protein
MSLSAEAFLKSAEFMEMMPDCQENLRKLPDIQEQLLLDKIV